MIFHDVVVSPYTSLFEGGVLRGGPRWPDFDRQIEPRHCRSGGPIDSEPDDVSPTAEIDRAAWGGPIVGHFGHAIADFSMRLLTTAVTHPDVPILFAASPAARTVRTLERVPPFLREIWEWFGVNQPRLLTEPTLVRELVVEPQAEQLGGPGPSAAYLDILDELVARKLGKLRRIPVLYVSRAEQDGRIAGELYIEEALRDAGATIIRPEHFALADTLRAYASADRLIFSEGSAIHAAQLLGRSIGDVTVFLRRTWPFGQKSLEPRARSLHYVNAVRGIVTTMQPSGEPAIGKGITLVHSKWLQRELGQAVPGIKFDVGEYERERDIDVARWLREAEPAHSSKAWVATVSFSDDALRSFLPARNQEKT